MLTTFSAPPMLATDAATDLADLIPIVMAELRERAEAVARGEAEIDDRLIEECELAEALAG